MTEHIVRVTVKLQTTDPDWRRAVARMQRILELNFPMLEIEGATSQKVVDE